MELFENLLESLACQMAVLMPFNTALSVTVVLLVAVGILALFLSIQHLRSKTECRRLPPGPRGVPFLGYLPFVSRQIHKDFFTVSQQYGNVFGLSLGTQYVVILGDYEAIKEGMSKEELLARPHQPETHKLFGENSVATTNGPAWREQRRFTLQQLRNVGLGKKGMEHHMQEEILEMVKAISEHDGKPFELQSLLEASMSNNITALLFGKRLDYTDPQRIKLDYMLREILSAIHQASFQMALPKILSDIIIFLAGFREQTRRTDLLMQEFKSMIRESIEMHKEDLDEENLRDFLDCFLTEIKKRKGSPQEMCYNEEVLGSNAFLYYIGGSETGRTVLSWFLIHMATHPDVQEKVYQEIISVIGTEKLPTWADHLNMPFCEAVIAEVHRIRPVLPIGVVRCPMEDVEVQGFTIPKGAWVFPNIWAVHQDQKYWKDPENFRPERFLNSEGKFVKSERVIPFVIGKRSCPGEQFGNLEVFLYAVSLIQRFKVLRQEGKELDMEGALAATLCPRSLNVVLVKRDL